MAKDPILILGAHSDMALAIARRFAAEGHALQLAARDVARLEAVKTDLALRGNVPVSLHEFDVLDTGAIHSFLDGLPELATIAICAVGTMGEQAQSETDMAQATRDLRSNFEGPALVLGEIANRMAARGRGTIVGISSVAGDRGRATNYIYGAAKAGFSAFLSGLRNRLGKDGVHVLTVKPGFVKTRMTEDMDLPEKLTAEPEEVAEAIFKALKQGRNVIYVRTIWWAVMLVIRLIPERIFKKLSI